MSEKLNRCRKELTAAIDRAVEDLSVPFHPFPNSATNQNYGVQTTQSLMPPCANFFYRKEENTSPVVCYPQQFLPVSSAPEKENPFFRPNFTPLPTVSNPACLKREPLTSKENTCVQPQIFMADRQFFVNWEESERWRKGHLSKTDERPVKSEPCLTACDVRQETPKHFADMTANNVVIWPSGRLQRKTDFENELQQICRISNELGSPEDISALALNMRSRFREVLQPSLEDEAIIETLLDMEEDYRPNSSTLH